MSTTKIETAPRPTIAGLYAIADSGCLAPVRLPGAVEQAIAGGARLVQYRDKGADAAARRRTAQAMAGLCRRHGIPFIVNDDVALAAAVGANGVHLGRDDAPLEAARAQLGSGAIIGVSCYDQLDRALAAQTQGADYVAFGRFFPSRTKPEAVPAPIELLRAARARLAIPIVAIGGITPDNGAALVAAGADALAVIEGLFSQPDVRAAAGRYAELFNRP